MSVLFVILFATIGLQAQIFNVHNATKLNIASTTKINTFGNVKTFSSGTISFASSGTFNFVGGLEHNGFYLANSSLALFSGSQSATISGTSAINFWDYLLNKSSANQIVFIYNTASFSVVNDFTLQTGVFNLADNSSKSISITKDLLIASNAKLQSEGVSATSHTLSLAGNIDNSGTFQGNTNSSNVLLNLIGATSNTLIGTNGTNSFAKVHLSKTSSNTFTFNSSFTADNPFLTLGSGYFNLAGSSSYTNSVFSTSTNTYTIPASATFGLNNSNFIVSGQAKDINLSGGLRLANGTLNIGTTGNNNNLFYNSGSAVNISGGSLNIMRNFARIPSNNSASISYSHSAGTVTVGIERTSLANRGVFDIGTATSRFIWSGGDIIIKQNSSAFGSDYLVATSGNVTGGNLNLIPNVNTTPETTFRLNSTAPMHNVTLIDDNGSRSGRLEVTGTSATINNDLTLVNRGIVFNNLDLNLKGHFTNNSSTSTGNLNQGSGTFIFLGSNSQTISGIYSNTFGNLYFNKDAGKVYLQKEITLNGVTRIMNNSVINIDMFDVHARATSTFYSDMDNLNSYGAMRCFQANSGSIGGRLIKYFEPTTVIPATFHFPIGTNGVTDDVYSGAELTFYNINSASFTSGAYISIIPIRGIHPAIEQDGYSLKKYWQIKSSGVTIGSAGFNMILNYDNTEAQGSQSSYQVLLYSPNYNNPAGFWRVNPGRGDIVLVDFALKTINTENSPILDGDWTAGEEKAAIATYYSRQNGNYNDPTTWSKVAFGGSVSNTAPTKPSDKIRIKDHLVTLTASTSTFNKLSVEDKGTLKFLDENFVLGDSLFTLSGATLDISSINGISEVGANGNVRTTPYRDYGSSGIFKYSGTMSSQNTGNGLPVNSRSLIVAKTGTNTLLLTKNTQISESLVINGGILDMGSYTVDGSTSGRTITMTGGELWIRNLFPVNYTPPTLTAGTVNFLGASTNVTIPSASSNPGVAQYFNLKVSGTYTSSVNFNNGETRIAKDFDISNAYFSGTATQRFFTAGSTILFNGNSGTQSIQNKPEFPNNPVSFLNFDNLIIDGASEKLLTNASGTTTYKVLGNLTLRNSATFNPGVNDIEVQGDWTNSGTATFFTPNTSSTTINSIVSSVSRFLTMGSIIRNPFYNLIIAGPGNVVINDNLLVNNNFTISNLSNFFTGSQSFTLLGNWTNNGGVFSPQTSTITLLGVNTQTFTKTSIGNEQFNDLFVNNPKGINISNVGTTTDNGFYINNNIHLLSGIVTARNRQVTVVNNLLRTGLTPGHIDGPLRKNVTSNSNTITYEVGYSDRYTPTTLEFNGNSGVAGLLEVTADTLNTSTTYGIFHNGSNILPANNSMAYNKSVLRQWKVAIPSGSAFTLGSPTRTVDLTFNFINGVDPNGDLRNSSNPTLYESRIWDGVLWTTPNLVAPLIGTRTASTSQLNKVSTLGYYMIGEPTNLTFYSKASGNWTTPTNWSTQSYTGVAATIEPVDGSTIYIGNSTSITLNTDKTFSNPTNIILDSNGVLLTNTQVVIGASSTFTMREKSTLHIGSVVGIRAAGSNGNIQVGTRNYNGLNNHNQSSFVYTLAGDQTQLDEAIPDTIAFLRLNKSSGTLTWNKSNITITDSLGIQSGVFRPASRVSLQGNLGVYSNSASFNPNVQTFEFAGSKNQFVTAYANLDFYNLSIKNSLSNGYIKFNNTGAANNATFINVSNSFSFESSNLAYIDLSSKVNTSGVDIGLPIYNDGEWIFNIQSSSSYNRVNLGHIDGELRRWVPTGTISNFAFDVGRDVFYRPVTLNFTGTGGGEVAGIIGAQNIYYLHPSSTFLVDPGYSYQDEKLLKPYWRITTPTSSSFNKGNVRTSTYKMQYDDTDIFPGAQKECFDIVYWKGGSSTFWQGLTPALRQYNYGSVSGCGDRNVLNSIASYFVGSSATSTQANTIAAGIDFGYTNLSLAANNRLLLADFLAGQQGNNLTFYYSKNNGNWSDPNTWVTGSYSSTVNSTGSFPNRRLDGAKIGEGKTVTLNCNIGGGVAGSSGSEQWNQQRLGSVIVEETAGGKGKLEMRSYTIKTSVMQIKDGGILETGSVDGFPSVANSGNIQFQANGVSINKDYNYELHNNGNFLYKPWGRQVTWGADNNYCLPDFDNTARSISDLGVALGGTYTSPFYTHASTPVVLSLRRYLYLANEVVDLVAGNTYTFRVTGTARSYVRVWVDYNYSGAFDVGEKTPDVQQSAGAPFIADVSLTIPSSAVQGTTRLRIVLDNNNGSTDPCSTADATGEVKDYTVNIINSASFTQLTYVTGNGVPANIANMTVNSSNSPSATVTLTQGFNSSGSFTLTAGSFNSGANSSTVQGDVINNAANNSLNYSSSLTLAGNSGTQNITGSFNSIIGSLILEKNSGEVNMNRNLTISSQLFFKKDNLLNLGTNSLTFTNAGSAIGSSTGLFSNTRMINCLGTTSSGTIFKDFTTANGSKTFFIPIGSNGTYNPANLVMNATTVVNPSIGLRLINAQQPNRLNNNILNKYWSLIVSNTSGTFIPTLLQFYYNASDVSGNASRYIPGLYNYNTSAWEINIGTSPIANPSPITINNPPFYNGDWSAGESNGFFIGRIFYSKNNGNWNVPANWSNIGHNPTDPAASYYPGEVFERDAVVIDGHTINYNVAKSNIESIQIGGAFAGSSTLTMGSSPLLKSLYINYNVSVKSDGNILGAAPTGRRDTIYVGTDFENLSTGSNSVTLHTNNSDYTLLEFNTGVTATITSSTISGSGNWGALNLVTLNKTNGLSDTLFVNSPTYAAATTFSSAYSYIPTKGVLKHFNSYLLSLSATNKDVIMQPFSGIYQTSGTISSGANFTNNINTTLNLAGGKFQVGDVADENFIYQTGSSVTMSSNTFVTAGYYGPSSVSSNIKLNILNNALLEINTLGNNTASKNTFDVSNSNSTFTQSSGTINIVRATLGANADYIVSANAAGTTITGGALQLGKNSVTPANSQYKVKGTVPIWDLTISGSSITGQVFEQDFYIQNNILANTSNTFQLRGNTLNHAGNLTINGLFDPITGSANTDSRIYNLYGSNNQNIYNALGSGIEIFNLTLSKPAGTVTLAATGNSNIIIRNRLDFASNNSAYIDASSGSFSRFVELSPSGGSNPDVYRSGLGHVHGKVKRYITNLPSVVTFPVGGANINLYRPIVVTTTNSGATPGILTGANYPLDHPKLDFNFISLTKTVPAYWNLTTEGFALANNQTFKLGLGYNNPLDIRNGALNGFLEQFQWMLPCPTPYANCPGSGTWTTLKNDAKTPGLLTAKLNSTFGDYAVSEPSGLTYYSIKNGNWDDPSCWSNSDYTSTITAVTYPQLGSDIVKIGNNKKITLPDNFTSPTIRALYLENYLGNPGTFDIRGQLKGITGDIFAIDDGCTIEIEPYICFLNSTSSGLLRFTNRTFGLARYVFNNTSKQVGTGPGFPDNVRTVISELKGTNGNNIFEFNNSSNNLFIEDSLYIKQGRFAAKTSAPILIGKALILGEFTNWDSTEHEIIFDGPSSKTISVGNQRGLPLHKLTLKDGNVELYRGTTGLSSSTNTVRVTNQLKFDSTGRINTRLGDRKVIVFDNASIIRTNAATSGYVDGKLARNYSASSGTLLYEVGNSTTYSPATLELTNGSGTAGYVDMIVQTPVADEPFTGNRFDINRKINRYWSVSSADNIFQLGNRRPSTTFGITTPEKNSITFTDLVVRRYNTTESYTWTEKKGNQLSWNLPINSVGNSETSKTWDGLGDFFIGAKAKRVFYSVSSGSWSNNSTWAFDAAGTIPAPSGIYPNSDWQNPAGYELEVRDSVVIQSNNTVTLNTFPEVSYLNISSGGRLLIDDDNKFIRQSSYGTSAMYLQSGVFENKSTLGIDSDTATSLFRFTQSSMTFSPTFNYLFSGDQAQKFGTGFPITIGSATISNTGSGANGIVSFPSNTLTLNQDLVVNSGSLRAPSNSFTLNSLGNIYSNTFLNLSIDLNGNPICPPVIFSGSGTVNQVLTGAGGFQACSILMNRGAGLGVVLNNTSTTVTSFFDFMNPGNNNKQVFELGTNNLTLLNSNQSTGLLDFSTTESAPQRYFRTSATGSYLNLTIAPSATYTFPVGTLTDGLDKVSIASYLSNASGTTGLMGVKAANGSNPSATFAHLSMNPVAVDYIGKYWSINNVTTSISGTMTFQYANSDIFGTEALSDKIGQWGNPGEGSSSSWTIQQSSSYNHLLNQFTTNTNTNPALLTGDWALAQLNSYKRLFYSRQSGSWNDPNSWTANAAHSGAVFGAGLFPNLIQDSVVIGGGLNGANNHRITLASNTSLISGVALGGNSLKTATLSTSTFTLNLQYFEMYPQSTLEIGSQFGITSSSTLGNIVTTVNTPGSRSFTPQGFYVYNGNTSQTTGDGLPSNIIGLTINNNSGTLGGVVTLANSTTVSNTFSFVQGTFDLGTNKLESLSSGTYSQYTGTMLRLGGTNSLLNSVNNYATYNLDLNSTIEFYGNSQTISSLPTNLTSGLSFVNLTGAGQKFVNAPLLIRKDLNIINNAEFINSVGVNALNVRGSIKSINNAKLRNDGQINVGSQ